MIMIWVKVQNMMYQVCLLFGNVLSGVTSFIILLFFTQSITEHFLKPSRKKTKNKTDGR